VVVGVYIDELFFFLFTNVNLFETSLHENEIENYHNTQTSRMDLFYLKLSKKYIDGYISSSVYSLTTALFVLDHSGAIYLNQCKILEKTSLV